ncbi:SDR family NAD(P)-dependent oxidoreductase [Microbacterium sp. 4R-513]|uniref:SDR family NAD(P)-dependent oxidoreductase n=1 Tax=Microbacterium sp. 4R-513 TaxID=2567934 RepID=UPI0013E1866B|nr:SDR family NAD(P)-dependent oxidoreductase [Microbacterium sp. 4R-513]QIG39898.1 SDR family NAD(P)-dependent oxidoreductase [Microbacterium sp. 4R-513]
MTEASPNSRSAIVTGGGRGVGLAAVKVLSERGWSVIALARDVRAARAALAGHPSVDVRYADLRDPASLVAVADTLPEDGIDLVVANAAQFAPWDETTLTADLDGVRDILEVNVIGTWRTVQAFSHALIRSQGSLIIVGSGGGSHGDPDFGIATNPGAVSYAASKAAVHALGRKAALELGEKDVAVYVVDPGLTATAPGMAEMGARDPRSGALSILRPVLGEGFVPAGSFSRDGRPLDW